MNEKIIYKMRNLLKEWIIKLIEYELLLLKSLFWLFRYIRVNVYLSWKFTIALIIKAKKNKTIEEDIRDTFILKQILKFWFIGLSLQYVLQTM